MADSSGRSADEGRFEIPIELIDEFDEGWITEQRPRIEAFLPRVPEHLRFDLLRELLTIEWEHQRRNGQRIDAASYRARFPDAGGLIDDALENLVRQPVTPEPPHTQAPAAPGTFTGVAATRYRIESKLGQGGICEVFLAWDRGLSRQVAVKIIKSAFVNDVHVRRRFKREAEVIGRLEHPGIIPIHDYGQFANGEPYYSMRLVLGHQSLETRIRQAFGKETGHRSREGDGHWHSPEAVVPDSDRRGFVPDSAESSSRAGSEVNGEVDRQVRAEAHRWPWRKRPYPSPIEMHALLEKFLSMTDTLSYAHNQGIIHRDIKPEHLMLGQSGESFLVDWGFSLIAESPPAASGDALSIFGTFSESAFESRLDRPGTFVGTPEYCSPEQALGLPCNTACDIYALGATLYHIMTGRPPRIAAPDRPNLIEAARMNAYDPPRQVEPALDRAMEAIIRKAMATKPRERYLSARELGDDVRRWMADEPVRAWNEPWYRRINRKIKRHRGAATLAAIGGLIILALGYWLTETWRG